MNRQARRQAQRQAAKPKPPSAGSRARLLADARSAYHSGRLDDAEQACRTLLGQRPGDRAALQLLGESRLRRAILADLRPHGADRGPDAGVPVVVALQHLGRREEAEQLCRERLATDPSDVRTVMLLATVLREQGRLDEAAGLCRRALTTEPRTYAWTELGLTLRQQDRLVEAADAFRRGVELGPDSASAHIGYGLTLVELGELDEAVPHLERAGELEPSHSGPLNNLALVLVRMGRFSEAIEAFDRAIALTPDNLTLRYNRAYALLGVGDLERGWAEYDHGLEAGDRQPRRSFPVPRWDGSPRPEATLMVWREQGVGDELRMASCYGDAADRVGRLVIECDPRLVSLLARSFPQATVRPERAQPGEVDVDLHCPIASLPRYLRPSVAAFPDHGGYLVAEPQLRDQWRARLRGLGDGLKVGICWRSMNLATRRLGHYTTLDDWAPVLAVPGIRFVNLQYGHEHQVEHEIAGAGERHGAVIHRWDDLDYTNDFEGVAALTGELDLVVGVNTAPSMLAGALGRAVHMLSLADPFTLGTDRYPWMPSVQLHPRSWDESWEHPIAGIAAALRAAVADAQISQA